MPRIRTDGKVDGRSTRWGGMSKDERRQAMAAAHEALYREGRDKLIAKLVAEAPKLTDAQRARLRLLLNPSDAGQGEAA
ncbi:MAG TPA: hypothetical protein VF223_18585 [Trebonia sp.]